MTGKAFCLIDARAVVLCGREYRVIPILVAQQLRYLRSPAGLSLHGGIAGDLIRNVMSTRTL